MSDGLQVVGYTRCSCGELELNHVAWHTGGRCYPCFMSGPERVRLAQIELIVAGSRRTVRTVRPTQQRARARRTKAGKGKKSTLTTTKAARSAALARLRDLYRPMYEVYYEEERRKRGMPPRVSVVRTTWSEALATLDIRHVYDAPVDPGVPDAAPAEQA